MERIELSKSAWKAEVLPLNYICIYPGPRPHATIVISTSVIIRASLAALVINLILIFIVHFTSPPNIYIITLLVWNFVGEEDVLLPKLIYSTGAPYKKAHSKLLSKERVFVEEPARNLSDRLFALSRIIYYHVDCFASLSTIRRGPFRQLGLAEMLGLEPRIFRLTASASPIMLHFQIGVVFVSYP